MQKWASLDFKHTIFRESGEVCIDGELDATKVYSRSKLDTSFPNWKIDFLYIYDNWDMDNPYLLYSWVRFITGNLLGERGSL